jgi:murein DD-endopeptidase MepM/ murein hydrolase activator NlpD
LNEQRVKLQANVAEAKREVNKLSDKHKALLRNKIAHESELNNAIKQLRKLTKGNKTGNTFSDKLRGLKLPVANGKVKQYKNNMAEILGAKDAAVTSIYEGKVIDIKRNKVNNKYDVYIAHGEYLSSYANLSEVIVEKGAIVKRNQRIGTIGSAVNIITMEMEYKIVFGIYSPSPSEVMSAEKCFKK